MAKNQHATKKKSLENSYEQWQFVKKCQNHTFKVNFGCQKLIFFFQKQARKCFRPPNVMKGIGIFLEFFWNFFWNCFGFFLEFLGGIFWEEFFGGTFWEEFFVYVVKVIKVLWIWKELIFLLRFWVNGEGSRICKIPPKNSKKNPKQFRKKFQKNSKKIPIPFITLKIFYLRISI